MNRAPSAEAEAGPALIGLRTTGRRMVATVKTVRAKAAWRSAELVCMEAPDGRKT